MPKRLKNRAIQLPLKEATVPKIPRYVRANPEPLAPTMPKALRACNAASC